MHQDLREAIRHEAAEIAQDLQESIPQLENAKQDLEARLAEVQAQLDAAHLATERLDNFPLKPGGDFNCPRCWIYDGMKAPLRVLPGEKDWDHFRCRKCDFELTVEV